MNLHAPGMVLEASNCKAPFGVTCLEVRGHLSEQLSGSSSLQVVPDWSAVNFPTDREGRVTINEPSPHQRTWLAPWLDRMVSEVRGPGATTSIVEACAP